MNDEVSSPPPPLPQTIDALITAYENAVSDASVLQEQVKERRDELSDLVEKFGSVPSNAKSMKRLEGLRKAVTLTWSTSTSIQEQGVAELQAYLEKQGMPELFDKFFELMPPAVYVPPPPKHRRVGDLFTVLAVLPKRLGKRIETAVAALYAQCTTTRVNRPSFKIETKS